MNGIEYSALANLLGQQWRRGSPATTTVANMSHPSVNSLNSEYRRNSVDVNPDTTTSITSNRSPRSSLTHRLNSMVDPPDYLTPTLAYKNSSHTTTSITMGASHHRTVIPSTVSRRRVGDYSDDFILVSEFSEIEGPRPLLTVPTDGAPGFNKNEYSLHLMCVDFHSHLNQNSQNTSAVATDDYDVSRIAINNDYSLLEDGTPVSHAGSTSKFGRTKDTSIINYWDLNARMVCACVQHFNLYDLEARGFVRPFCLAYVSFDQTPLTFFDDIRANFTKITDLFKQSNLNQFRCELEQRLADLAFTRVFFLKWVSMSTDERTRTIEEYAAVSSSLDARTIARLNSAALNEHLQKSQLSAIDNLIGEMRSVLKVVIDELRRRNWLQPFNYDHNYKYANRIIHEENSIGKKCSSAVDPVMISRDNVSIESDRLHSHRSMTFPFDEDQFYIKIEGIQNENSQSSKKSKNNQRRSDRCGLGHQQSKLYSPVLLSNNTVNFSLIEQLSSGNLPSPTSSSKRMKRLHELCEETARKAINEMRLMHRRFSMSHHLLKFDEILKSTPNVNRKSALAQRSLFWSMALGDTAVSNFMVNSAAEERDTTLNKAMLLSKRSMDEDSVDNIASGVNQKSLSISAEPTKTIVTSQISASADTQFFSIGKTDPAKSMIQIGFLDGQTTDSTNVSWKNLEKYLKEENEESKNIELDNEPSNEQFFSDEDDDESSAEEEQENKESSSMSNSMDKNDQIFSNNKSDHHMIESNSYNEYDFANSLLTLDSQLTQQYQKRRQRRHLLALSLATSSTALFYRTLSEIKFASSLGEKLTQMAEFNFEATLKRLVLNHYQLLPHLFYSILKGRPVVCVTRFCSEIDQLNALLEILSLFLPNSVYSLNSLIPTPNSEKNNSKEENRMRPELKMLFKRRPIRLNDLKYCKLFGLCLMCVKDNNGIPATLHPTNSNTITSYTQCCSDECNENLGLPHLSIHKHRHYHLAKSQDADENLLLKYIPITIRNYVSIFDIDNFTFTGPRYNGSHLVTSLARCKFLATDSLIYLHLLSNTLKFYSRVAFLCQNSILFRHTDTLNSKTESSSIQRKTSAQQLPTHMSRRERILRFYSMSNNSEASTPTTPGTTSVAASVIGSSIASLFSYSNSAATNPSGENHSSQYRRPSSVSYNGSSASTGARSIDIDVELLRLVLAASNSWSASINSSIGSTLSTSSSSLLFVSPTPVQPTPMTSTRPASLHQFEHSDLNIVLYWLKSMRIKQELMLDFAIHNKKRRQKTLQEEKTNDDYEPQIPLLLEYDELCVFYSSTKR